MKILCLILLFNLSWFVKSPVSAFHCHTYQNHEICLVKIKRSAKNYWEYRASVTFDGVKRPIEVYNCRTQKRINKDNKKVPFQIGGVGEFICQTLAK